MCDLKQHPVLDASGPKFLKKWPNRFGLVATDSSPSLSPSLYHAAPHLPTLEITPACPSVPGMTFGVIFADQK